MGINAGCMKTKASLVNNHFRILCRFAKALFKMADRQKATSLSGGSWLTNFFGQACDSGLIGPPCETKESPDIGMGNAPFGLSPALALSQHEAQRLC